MDEAEPSRTDQVLQKAAVALKWAWVATWIIHCHIFWVLAACIDRLILRDGITDTWIAFLDWISFVPGPLITPGIIIFLVNNIAGVFGEIQSYQIAYIIWGVCISIIYTVYIFWSNARDSNSESQSPPTTTPGHPKPSHVAVTSTSTVTGGSTTLSMDLSGITGSSTGITIDSDPDNHEEQFCKLLLLPFGFHSKDVGDSFNFTVPLVSLAPAIVGGYIANFILAKTYSLECDEIYNSIATICDKNGVCCVTVSNHDNVFEFVPDLVASMLAGWGIVKLIALLIITYDEEVELIEPEPTMQRAKTI